MLCSNSWLRFTLLACASGTALAQAQMPCFEGDAQLGAVAAGAVSRPADVDLDGDLDLAVGEHLLPYVQIHENRGDGTFELGARIPVAIPKLDLHLADLDSDGAADLVVLADSGTVGVDVRLNDGTGGFGPATRYDFSAQFDRFDIADVDGDGAPELVTVTITSPRRSEILVNNGAGAFSAPIARAADVQTIAYRWLDLDVDGDLDFVAPARLNGAVIVCWNGGVGTWLGAPVTLTLANAFAVEGADLDGDLDLDLLAGRTDGFVSVLRNTGGAFAAPVDAPAFGPLGNAPVLADLDGDLDVDVAVRITSPPSLSVLLNDGSGALGLPTLHALGTILTAPLTAPELADVDGDGDRDVLFTDTASPGIMLLRNPGNAAFAPRVTLAMAAAPTLVATADLGGDGRADVLVHQNGAKVAEVVSGARFDAPPAQRAYASATVPRGFAVGRMDAGPSLDVVTVNSGSNALRVLLNASGDPLATFEYTVGDFPDGVALADLDGDVDLDVVVASKNAGSVQIFANNGDGSLTALGTHSVTLASAVHVVDIDGDGALDLAIVGFNSVVLLKNLGTGTFVPYATLAGTGPGTSRVASGDFDGDGDVDFVAANTNQPTFFLQLSPSIFTSAQNNVVSPGGAISVLVVDIDGDTDDDLVFASRSDPGVVTVYEQGGPVSFLLAAQVGVGKRLGDVVAQDLDADGDLDLAVANPGGNGVAFLENRGANVFTPWTAYEMGWNSDELALADLDGDGVRDLVALNAAGSHVAVRRACPVRGEAFCFGDGTFADHTSACPCANFGAPGHGCAHSFSAAGALLDATGSTPIDTVTLEASSLPATSFTLFLQHAASGDTIFHDGVLCAGGVLVRLRGRAAVAGAAHFPNTSFAQDATLTLSQRGGVFPGAGVRRYYSAWYRNASTTFCPPATANVTNGWRVDW